MHMSNPASTHQPVTATASFGAPLSWKQDPKESRGEGYEMSFVEAISEVSENIFWLLAMPKVRQQGREFKV